VFVEMCFQFFILRDLGDVRGNYFLTDVPGTQAIDIILS